MRPRPSWASKYDDPILEFLDETGSAFPPSVLHFNLTWHEIASPAHSTVKRRLRILEQHDLVEKVDEQAGYYAISEKGRSYLSGELEPEEL